MRRVVLACAKTLAGEVRVCVRGRRILARSAVVRVPCAAIIAEAMSRAVISRRSVPACSKVSSLAAPILASKTATRVDSAVFAKS